MKEETFYPDGLEKLLKGFFRERVRRGEKNSSPGNRKTKRADKRVRKHTKVGT